MNHTENKTLPDGLTQKIAEAVEDAEINTDFCIVELTDFEESGQAVLIRNIDVQDNAERMRQLRKMFQNFLDTIGEPEALLFYHTVMMDLMQRGLLGFKK